MSWLYELEKYCTVSRDQDMELSYLFPERDPVDILTLIHERADDMEYTIDCCWNLAKDSLKILPK